MNEQKTPQNNNNSNKTTKKPTALLMSSSEGKPHLGKMLFSATKCQI